MPCLSFQWVISGWTALHSCKSGPFKRFFERPSKFSRCFWEPWPVYSYQSFKSWEFPKTLQWSWYGPMNKERSRVSVYIFVLYLARQAIEESCQDYLSQDRRNPCITHPEGCVPRSKRTSCSPDNENNEVRLSKETWVALPTNLSPRDWRRITRKVILSSQSQGQS